MKCIYLCIYLFKWYWCNKFENKLWYYYIKIFFYFSQINAKQYLIHISPRPTDTEFQLQMRKARARHAQLHPRHN